MQRHILTAVFVGLMTAFLTTGPLASAQSIITPDAGGCDFASGEVHASCIPDFLAHVIQFIFGFTGGISLVLIVIAGYQAVLGQLIGQENAWKETLKWAIIGLIVSALAFFIIDFIISTLSGNRGPPTAFLPSPHPRS